MKPQRLKTGHGRLIRMRQPNMLDATVMRLPRLRTAPPMPQHEGGGGDHAAQLQDAAVMQLLYGMAVLLPGAGAIGSYMAMSLAPYGVWLIVIDPDQVEQPNVMAGRTAYNANQLGQFKVYALKELIESRYPQARVEPYPYAVQDIPRNELRRLAERCTVAIGAIDDPPRLLELDALLHPLLPTLYVGLHRGAHSGHIILSSLGLPCLRCSMELDSPQQMRALHAEPGRGYDIARVAHTAAEMCLELMLASVTGRPITRWNIEKNIVYLANQAEALSPDGPGVHFEAGKRTPGCPVCGGY